MEHEGGGLFEDDPAEFFIEFKLFEEEEAAVQLFAADDGDDDEHAGDFCDDRGVGGAVEAEVGEAVVAIDESVVEYDVEDGFGDGADDKEAAVVGADEEGVAHLVYVEKWEAPYADVEEADGLGLDGGGV